MGCPRLTSFPRQFNVYSKDVLEQFLNETNDLEDEICFALSDLLFLHIILKAHFQIQMVSHYLYQ